LNASGVTQNINLGAPTSIVINALAATAIGAPVVAGLFVAPIRSAPATTTNLLRYDPLTREITYATKTFIINHPLDENKYLVHACLEGPEVGVYYRGTAEILDKYLEIELPEYVKTLATDFNVYVTHEFDEEIDTEPKTYAATKIVNNKFKIYGPNGKASWLVFGKRGDINVEPLKLSVNVKGDGPYKYI
jgi:hypothetical protein